MYRCQNEKKILYYFIIFIPENEQKSVYVRTMQIKYVKYQKNNKIFKQIHTAHTQMCIVLFFLSCLFIWWNQDEKEWTQFYKTIHTHTHTKWIIYIERKKYK